jgi:hypothetical protein
MDAWNEHGWPTKIPTWHTWILWSSSTNGHEVLCIIQIHDHRGVVERLNVILDTSLLKTFLCPFGRFEHDTWRKSIEDIPLPFWEVWTWYLTQVYWRHFFCPFGCCLLFGLWSFPSFSSLVLLPGVFLLFIYLLKASFTRKGPPNLVGSNETPIILYYILLAKD